MPVTPKGLDAIVPQPPKNQNDNTDNTKAIVVQLIDTKGGEPAYKINEDSFNKSDIEPKLASIFAVRATKVMFVKGDPNLFYGKVAEVIDFGHQAGVDNIGIITPQVEAGH